jgi:hypothetical protein
MGVHTKSSPSPKPRDKGRPKRPLVRSPHIVVCEPRLTVLLAKDNGAYCAKCPELDLVTELPSADEALADLLDSMREYATEYLQNRRLYVGSPNRAHHLPYVEAISACKTEWDLRSLIEIQHGFVHAR